MEKVKLPRSSYEELVKIIRSYGVLNKPCGLDDISHASGIGTSNVSSNNAFLSFLEIIEGGNKKVITQKGLKLSRALEHSLIDEIQQSWIVIINENDFLTKMLQAVKIRKGMEISQLENHIAFSSGEKKSGYVMTGARAVVDILISSGQLKQVEDKLLFQDSIPVYEEHAENKSESSPTVSIAKQKELTSFSKDQSQQIILNIELKISATPSELEGLGKKIKAVIDELQSE
jgi:hypothetical protein